MRFHGNYHMFDEGYEPAEDYTGYAEEPEFDDGEEDEEELIDLTEIVKD